MQSSETPPRLADVDLSRSLDRDTYDAELPALQVRLRRLAQALYRRQRPLVLVFEGWDAAGKGGAIRRLTRKLDPRGYRVFPIGAPQGDDAERHYLYRFWRRLEPPRDKQISIFDRSWYGRVLVERVEGFATKPEWSRAYREINEFERQLEDQGILLGKFFFHVSQEEQLRRFEARRETPHKRWKLTDEDWRNRDKWAPYEMAIDDMLARTSTVRAPWTVIAGEDKLHARITTLRTVAELLENALGDLDAEGDDAIWRPVEPPIAWFVQASGENDSTY